jgi:hypothetical protein
MVKFRLPCVRAWSNLTAPVTMPARAEIAPSNAELAIVQILIKADFVHFYENYRHIRIDFAQKRRFIANDSFNPVWYGLVQRRWESRRG